MVGATTKSQEPRKIAITFLSVLALSEATSKRLNFLPRCTSRGTINPRYSSSSVTVRGGSSSEEYNANTLPDPSIKGKCTIPMNQDPDIIIGGGAINEKKRTFRQGADAQGETVTCTPDSRVFRGTNNQAHLWHAMEGLDRYPNYLARWAPEDMDELEQALVNRLAKVREQRQSAQSLRERISAIVEGMCEKEQQWIDLLRSPDSWEELQQSGILDDRARNAIFRSKFFRSTVNYTIPSIQEVLDGKAKVELDAGYLENLIDEETFDVYSFPLLSDSFCDRIQAYTRRITQELEESQDPEFLSGARRMARNLDNVGLAWLNDLLFQLVVRPISRHLFQETEMGGEEGDLDWRHGYITAYTTKPDVQKPRQRLVTHTDDSEVTLNVCIGDVFEGGRLTFRGLRGTSQAGLVGGEYTPERGRALLHAGRQFHEVTDVTSGDRFALIMWTRSWGGIRSKTCPCCWLNRRQDNGPSSCICGERWN